MTSTRRLSLRLRPSWALAGWIAASHVVAGACVLAVFPGLPGAVLALLVGALGLAATWRTALLKAPGSHAVLELSEGGRLLARLHGGATLEAGKDDPRHVTRLWVVVPAGRVLVTADMLSPEEFRRLRVWALWGGIAGRAPAAELI